MAQFSASGLTTAVPTAARGPNIYATAAVRPRLLEVGVFNTTSTAMYVGLSRATAVGTKGAAITPVAIDDDSQAAVTTAAQTHTVDATVNAVPIRYARLGAADGSGVIWTFPDPGVTLDKLTTAGLVLVCPSGTGQQIAFYFHWRE
jgi:hypothetical protein